MPVHVDQQPPLVSILRLRSYLIASIHTALDDQQLTRFQHDLVERISRDRTRGVVIDVTAMDVLDSFAVRLLGDLSRMARLRGARTVVVGIDPDIAIAMVGLGITWDRVPTAFDVDDGVALLDSLTV
jgi:rsbT antagonist protein RsbS